MKPENYDFSCWVIKYGGVSSNDRIYQKDCLNSNDGQIVPLLWNHDHYNLEYIIGSTLLENRNEGVYAYCTLYDRPVIEDIKHLLRDRGRLSLSPYINQLKMDDKYIISGKIREVSLVFARIDPDEAYYPVLKEDV